MDARERVRCALLCRKPDRIPKSLGFFPQTLDALPRVTAEDHFGLDIRFVEFNPLKNQDKFRSYLGGLPDHVHVGSLAQLRTYHEWDYHPERGTTRPLSHVRSLKELVQYVLPNFTNSDRLSKISSQVERWHDQGLAVAGAPPHLGGELFEAAWRLRGFENFMIDLVQRKDMAGYLLDQLTEMMLENCLILARAGIDILLLDDDIAMPSQMMISLATWREHFKPRLEKVIRLVREESPEILIFYHSDGNFTPLIPELADIGVNVINPIQPDCMDVVVIKREFGDRLALWGAVGSARLWDEGTPDEIRHEVRRCIESLGPEGLLPAPAYDIDYAPFENIVAFIEAVEEFGGY